MKHIQREFTGSIQYVCIASPKESQTPTPMMFIQIILQKTINKKTYFLRAVAGADQTKFNIIRSTDILIT